MWRVPHRCPIIYHLSHFLYNKGCFLNNQGEKRHVELDVGYHPWHPINKGVVFQGQQRRIGESRLVAHFPEKQP